jgi:hypothetical protein
MDEELPCAACIVNVLRPREYSTDRPFTPGSDGRAGTIGCAPALEEGTQTQDGGLGNHRNSMSANLGAELVAAGAGTQ